MAKRKQVIKKVSFQVEKIEGRICDICKEAGNGMSVTATIKYRDEKAKKIKEEEFEGVFCFWCLNGVMDFPQGEEKIAGYA